MQDGTVALQAKRIIGTNHGAPRAGGGPPLRAFAHTWYRPCCLFSSHAACSCVQVWSAEQKFLPAALMGFRNVLRLGRSQRTLVSLTAVDCSTCSLANDSDKSQYYI